MLKISTLKNKKPKTLSTKQIFEKLILVFNRFFALFIDFIDVEDQMPIFVFAKVGNPEWNSEKVFKIKSTQQKRSKTNVYIYNDHLNDVVTAFCLEEWSASQSKELCNEQGFYVLICGGKAIEYNSQFKIEKSSGFYSW